MTDYTPATEEALYCSQCWADLKLYPPATELVFERDFTVNTETVRKVYRYVRTDATEFDRWLAEVKAQAWEEGQLALLEYMGVPLYSAKGDEPRNPKQPRNPYRLGEEQ